MFKCLLLRNYISDWIQTRQECSLDSRLQRLGFLFWYEIQDGGYGRTWFNIGPYGSHVGFPICIKNLNFVEDLSMIIPGHFGFNCPSGFREQAFWNIFPIGSNENVQMPSSQKLQILLKRNCTWMFIGWSSTNFTFFVPIRNSKWRLRQDFQC
jgi:hypothetical protein